MNGGELFEGTRMRRTFSQYVLDVVLTLLIWLAFVLGK